jgi:hypothetical protein
MVKYRTILKLSVILFSTLFVLTILINDNNIYANSAESNENQPNIESSTVGNNANSKPLVFVEASCMVGSAIIPGEFTGTGFPPNKIVIVESNKNNLTGGSPTEPVTILFNKLTDHSGNITGEFNLNTLIQPNTYRDYFLHIYSLDNPDEAASASLDLC